MDKVLAQNLKNVGDFYFYEDREYYENKPIAVDLLRRFTIDLGAKTRRLILSVKDDFPLSYDKDTLKSVIIPAMSDLSKGIMITDYDLLRNSKNAAYLHKEGVKQTDVDYFLNYRKCDFYIEHIHSSINVTTTAVTAPTVKQWNDAASHMIALKDLCRTTTTTSVRKEKVLRLVLMTVTGVLQQRDIAKHYAIDDALAEKLKNAFAASLKNPPNFMGAWVVDNGLISQTEYFAKGETYPIVLTLGSVIY